MIEKSCTITEGGLSYTFPQQRFNQLEKEKQSIEGDDQASKPKIQRVPIFLRENAGFAKYCSPKMISFGPIHHGNGNLKQGEHYKLFWTSRYLEEYSSRHNHQDTERAAQVLHKRIEDNIEELKKLFTVDAIGSHNDKDLAWMLFVDGCSLLHFMGNVDDQHPEALKLKLDQLMYMWRDIELLENQLPWRVLELLSKEEGADLEYLLNNFSNMGWSKRLGQIFKPFKKNYKPTHILDFIRSIYLSGSNDRNTDEDRRDGDECDRNTHEDHDLEKGKNVQNQQDGDLCDRNTHEDHDQKLQVWQTYKNIRDLKAAGIRVMANEEDEWSWSNISFTSKWFSGELRLPVFLFNDVTPYFFRNLIAYEMCPDFHNNYECCSFLSFMDSLIDTAEDVKELRLAGIFQNLLGSDEELAKLFNELGTDLPTKMFNFWSTDAVAYSMKYILVKHQIQNHYRNKWKTWLAEVYNTHFNTPWAVMGVWAALLALVLSFIQAWYSANPKKTK